MSDGVLYIAWDGRNDIEAILSRSIESLKATNPQMPYEVVRLPAGASLLDKAGMYDMSPFERTVFLDADTVVLADLEPIFQSLHWNGIACTICECPWACRYDGLKDKPNLIEYNTGVLGWQKFSVAHDVFRAWHNYAKSLPSAINWMMDGKPYVMAENDQAAFAWAMHECKAAPLVLPLNWNFRPRWHHTWFGPVKIWHDYKPVPPELLAFNARAQPMDFAMARFVQ